MLHRLHATSPLFALAFRANRSTWHHSVEWKGALDVEVVGTARAEATASFDLDATVAALEATDVPPLPPAVVAALACPGCRGPVALGRETASCRDCEAEYLVVRGVPILIPPPGAGSDHLVTAERAGKTPSFVPSNPHGSAESRRGDSNSRPLHYE